MTILEKIVAKKRERLSSSKHRTSLSELKSLIRDVESPRDFQKAIKRDSGAIRLIAEIKKASPSKGLIRSNFNHLEIAAIYENEKVDAISVLTEEDFFQGKLEFILDVKKIITRPILQKDFIFDTYQIYEARANHADAILLIAAILETNQAQEYLNLSQELRMSTLFEVHNLDELEMALKINTPVIGINNRDLKTLRINLNTTFELKKEIPEDRIVVTESGIKSREDVLLLEKAGLDAMLIGTSFMESQNIAAKINELRGGK